MRSVKTPGKNCQPEGEEPGRQGKVGRQLSEAHRQAQEGKGGVARPIEKWSKGQGKQTQNQGCREADPAGHTGGYQSSCKKQRSHGADPKAYKHALTDSIPTTEEPQIGKKFLKLQRDGERAAQFAEKSWEELRARDVSRNTPLHESTSPCAGEDTMEWKKPAKAIKPMRRISSLSSLNLSSFTFQPVGVETGGVRLLSNNDESEEWFLNHPHKDAILEDPERFIPLRLHGDGIMIRQWTSTQVREFQRNPIMLEVLEDANEHTYEALNSIMLWSFNLCAEGKWPNCDHAGRPFTSTDGHRYDNRGLPFAGGLRGALSQILGDWKWEAECLGLPQNYKKNDMCHDCYCTKKGPLSFKDLREDNPGFVMRHKHEDWRAAVEGKIGLLKDKPLHKSMVKSDFMHVGPLGIPLEDLEDLGLSF